MRSSALKRWVGRGGKTSRQLFMLLKSGQEKRQACLLGVAEEDDLFWTDAGGGGSLNLIWAPQREAQNSTYTKSCVPPCVHIRISGSSQLFRTFITINYLSMWKIQRSFLKYTFGLLEFNECPWSLYLNPQLSLLCFYNCESHAMTDC